MINIDKDITFYYLNTDPRIGFTLDEFFDAEMIAFKRVEKDNTPLFCQHKSKSLGKFFSSLN